MATSIPSLPYDLIARVMELCADENDYDLLFHCSLVNWEFNRAASRVLYSRVVLDPPFKGPVLDLRDVGAIPKSSNFDSACLPRNAAYVTSLKISGYISARPPPRNTLPQKLTDALPTFINLSHLEITPKTYHESMLDGIVPLLSSLQRLTELVVNASCTGDDERAGALVGVGWGRLSMRKLTLVSPGRRILELLPGWLSELSKTLVELHLKNNCGSVTPGVLKSVLPFVNERLEGFTLGLSYSLTNQDVFDFLNQLTKLRVLELHYYWAQQQLKPPERLPSLPTLRSFTATHPATYTRLEVDRLDKWVRWIIARSPDLEVCRLRCEGEGLVGGGGSSSGSIPSPSTPASLFDPEPSYVSHDALVTHLSSARHGKKLRVLDFGTALVRVDKLELVLASCPFLEDVSMSVDKSALTLLATRTQAFDTPSLRSLSLLIVNAHKRSYFYRDIIQPEYNNNNNNDLDRLVLEVMERRQPSLRRVCVNGVKWEARWKAVDVDKPEHEIPHTTNTSTSKTGLELVAQKVVDPVPPWERRGKTS